jgi:hypothetical protein
MLKSPFDKLATLAHEHANWNLLGKKGQLFGEPEETEMVTFFHLIKRDGGHDIVATPWGDAKEKKELVFNVCLKIIKDDVIAFSFVSEVWTARATHEGSNAPPPIGKEPRNRPDRQEAVVCLMGDAKETHFKSWEIVRDQNRICTELKEVPEGIGFQSWIADALQRAIKVNGIDGGKFRDRIKEFLP